MSKLVDKIIDKLKGSGKVMNRLLMGIVVPVLILSTTYSSVFFMKGELGWASLYWGIMAASGWCLIKLYKCSKNKIE